MNLNSYFVFGGRFSMFSVPIVRPSVTFYNWLTPYTFAYNLDSGYMPILLLLNYIIYITSRDMACLP